MIAYLKSDALPKPTAVTLAWTAGGSRRTVGSLTSTIRHGELFLRSKSDAPKHYRVCWSPKDKRRTRSLPVGEYVVTGYRHVATAKDGAPWVWSTTSPGYAELEVKPEATTHFEVCDALVAQARAVERGGKHRVGLVFVSEKKLGNTLYRKGRRIGITWHCLDADGKVLAEGPMRYG